MKREFEMKREFGFLCGMSLGASLMFFFDPRLGPGRRSLVRDQFVKALHRIDRFMYGTWRDVSQRTQGMAAETAARFRSEHPSDGVVASRVRSQIGRHVSHPRSIDVAVRGGQVTLSGPVLAHEVDELMSTVSTVRGVAGVKNALDVHEHAGNISGLQGGCGCGD
jgi:hypothetical protein